MTKDYIKENYPNVKNWIYLDTNSNENPDVVGSIFDLITLIKMGLSQYDVIILDICFLGGNVINAHVKEAQLLAAALLAKSGGKIIYVNMTKQYLTELQMRAQTNEEKAYVEVLRGDINSLNILYTELAAKVGLKFLEIERRKRERDNFEYDYVSFIRQ